MSKSVGYMFVSRLPGVRQSGFIVKRNKFTWKAGLVDLGIAVLGTTTAWVAEKGFGWVYGRLFAKRILAARKAAMREAIAFEMSTREEMEAEAGAGNPGRARKHAEG